MLVLCDLYFVIHSEHKGIELHFERSMARRLAVTFFALAGITRHATQNLLVDISSVITRIRGGDRSAFAELVTHYQSPLFSYLGRMGLTQAAAQDIAQEAFLRAWTSLGSYDPARAAFSTWLFTIARNLALNHVGKKCELTTDEELPEAICERQQPPEQLEQAQRRQQLLAALKLLPIQDRSALALAYFQELDLAGIARVEGCNVGAIKTRLSRARMRLRQLLEKDDAQTCR